MQTQVTQKPAQTQEKKPVAVKFKISPAFDPRKTRLAATTVIDQY